MEGWFKKFGGRIRKEGWSGLVCMINDTFARARTRPSANNDRYLAYEELFENPRFSWRMSCLYIAPKTEFTGEQRYTIIYIVC